MRARDAIRAAELVARRTGLDVQTSTVLAAGERITLLLRPCRVVAKVAPGERQAAMRTEVAVARHVVRTGGPVVAPLEDPWGGVHLEADLAVSLWRHVEPIAHAADAEAAAWPRYLELRRALDRFPGRLPPFTASVHACSSAVDSLIGLTPADVTLLRSVLDDGLAQIDALRLRPVPLHGDPHAGNLIPSSRGFLWLDFESACLGPREWDLSALPADRTPPQFLTPALRLFLRVRRACVVVWSSRHPNRGPREDEAIAVHLAALRDAHAA